jgi:Dolichyl-phosphate-mannose-protein mannosyltransferase
MQLATLAAKIEKPSAMAVSHFGVRAALVMTLIFVGVVRLRLAPCPLERDEGEYAFVGQLMLEGIPPYKEAANMKFPGTYAAYAAIESVFGETARGIHYGLLVVNLSTILLVYHVGLRFLRSKHTALMAAVVYAVSSLSFCFLGPMAHATHFVVFFGLAGIALVYAAIKWDLTIGFALAGAVTGLAYMAKQSGFFFVPFGCILLLSAKGWHLLSRPALRALSYFLVGAFSPFALTVFLLQRLGSLDEFAFWTFRYASTYGMPLKRAPGVLAESLAQITGRGYAWIFFVPCILIFLPKVWRACALPRRSGLLLATFLALSLTAVSLGFYFRDHYWIQALPVAALLSALFLRTAATMICRHIGSQNATLVASILCVSLCGSVLAREGSSLFVASPAQIIWQIYQGQPFIESIAVADYIRRNTKPSERIFVFGSEPEIYFYAKRRSVTNNLYLDNLLENQPYAIQMQRRMVSDVENSSPRYFVEVHYSTFPYDISQKIPLFLWKSSYLAENYRLVFVLDRDLSSNKLTLNPRSSSSGCFIALWERR